MSTSELTEKGRENAEFFRKSNRESCIMKRRSEIMNESVEAETQIVSKSPIADPNMLELITACNARNVSRDDFAECGQKMTAQQIVLKHEGVIGLRKIICAYGQEMAQLIIDAHLVPVLFSYMDQTDYKQLKLEAAWIFVNMLSGKSSICDSLAQRGIIPLLVRLLVQNEEHIIDQAVWAIGNLGGDNSSCRDAVLTSGALQPLLIIAESTSNSNLIRLCAWTISNLCRGNPLPKHDLVKAALPTLAKIVMSNILSESTLSDVLWAINSLGDKLKSRIQRLVDTGIVPTLIKLATLPDTTISMPAIRILGNISNGNEMHTEQLLKNDIFQVIHVNLRSFSTIMCREASWLLSNIAGGTPSQSARVAERIDIIELAVVLFDSSELSVREQLAFFFANLGYLGDKNQAISVYLHYDIMRLFANFLKASETSQRSMEACLDCLFSVFNIGEDLKSLNNGRNILKAQFDKEPGALPLLLELQHGPEVIYNKVKKIILAFYEVQTEDNDNGFF